MAHFYPFSEIKTNTGEDVTKYKLTGQEWDAESGLYYYNARYYDPKLARFISADTIVPDFADPQSLNRYSYVINNPVIYTDPSGHGFFSDLWDDIKEVVKPVIAVVAAVAAYAIVGPAATGLVEGLVGCGAYCTPLAFNASATIGGAIGGAIAGSASSTVMGADIGQGALIGAVSGGIAGGVGAQSFSNKYIAGMAQIGSGAVSGGIASEMSGGKFSEGFKIGAITAGAMAFVKTGIDKYLATRPMAEAEADSIHKAKWYPKEDKLTSPTTNVSSIKTQLEVVRDKFKLSSFWSAKNQIRIGRYDAKFYNENAMVTIHKDTIDIRVNPIGHLFCDKLQLCH